MDPLAGDSDSDTSASGSGSDAEAEQQAKRPKAAAPKAAAQPQIDPEALVSGTSVLFVPEPKADGAQDWEW
jgi:hypothetical protein